MKEINLQALYYAGVFDTYGDFSLMRGEGMLPNKISLFEGSDRFQHIYKRDNWLENPQIYLLTEDQVSNFNKEVFNNLQKFKVKNITSNENGEYKYGLKTIEMNRTQLGVYNSLGISQLIAVGVKDIERIFKNF